MALTKCSECGHQISKSATQCPGCGAKIRRTGLFTKIVAGVFGVVFLSMFMRQCSPDSVPTPAPRESTNVTYDSTPGTTPAQRAEAARVKNEQEAQALGLKWSYKESSDPMGRGTVKQADVNSINQVNFDFPYRGPQRGELTLRIHPKHGKDVILSIKKGQFVCGVSGCTVSVRFDQGKAQKYSAVEPADYSTTYLFLQGYDRFVAAAKKSKRVFIEAQFYQEGPQVFEFDIADLKW